MLFDANMVAMPPVCHRHRNIRERLKKTNKLNA
nr:MAG TPA: hypothetical protein [Caudoviricetes sp.]